MQSNQYTAVLKHDGKWWIGWIEEVPGVNCQERTREKLLKTLKTTLAEALEMNREEARFQQTGIEILAILEETQSPCSANPAYLP